MSREGSTATFSCWLFLRPLGAVYLIAFVSLWTQLLGLVGQNGILPAMNGEPMTLTGFSETEYRLFTHKSAVVTPDHHYKLIYTHENNRRELYDLAQDPTEHQDMAEANPKLADMLQAQLQALLSTMTGTVKNGQDTPKPLPTVVVPSPR